MNTNLLFQFIVRIPFIQSISSKVFLVDGFVQVFGANSMR